MVVQMSHTGFTGQPEFTGFIGVIICAETHICKSDWEATYVHIPLPGTKNRWQALAMFYLVFY